MVWLSGSGTLRRTFGVAAQDAGCDAATVEGFGIDGLAPGGYRLAGRVGLPVGIDGPPPCRLWADCHCIVFGEGWYVTGVRGLMSVAPTKAVVGCWTI